MGMNSTGGKTASSGASDGAFIGRLAAIILGGWAIGLAGRLAATELWHSYLGLEASELTRLLSLAGIGIGGVLGLGEHIPRTGRLPGPGWRAAAGQVLLLFAVAAAAGIVFLPLLPAGPNKNAFGLPILSWVFALAMAILSGQWLALKALRRLPESPGAEAMPGGLFARAEDIFGRFPLEVLALYGGLLPAWAMLHATVPQGWCGGAAADDWAAFLTLMMLTNRGGRYPMTGGRTALLVGTGFAGGLAALTAAWLVGGCTGLAAWAGWERRTAEIVAAVPVALLATLISVAVDEAYGLEPEDVSAGKDEEAEA
jgi:hypothetical protein